MGVVAASGVVAGARSAATTGAVRAKFISGVTAGVAMPPTRTTSAMGAACVVEGVAKPAKTGAAGEVRTPATAGTAEACTMAALPATAARATSNAERRHSTGEVVWIMRSPRKAQ
ncbi:hypothetical protein BI312_13700 [Xanthomonas citri pv. citri]|nr:hypothetical protein BI314_01265 [Xanthomonas citri pv. citri]QYF42837.1 hypothetical protein HZS93_00078 [Xanthomonas citri]APR17606.1 hypothetical protein BI315_13640 [Xanthomonas citri pv. citri]APR22036.1 hypothetical protein BI316_01680 [Xanthomonas citri pv. citri]APR27023.1 hypothetical protein BJD09_16255 [Xanthomonas citri pv. citri]